MGGAKKEQLVEIKTYFSTLFAHHQIGQDTFIEVTELLDKPRFSDSEQQQYDLIVEVFESKKLAGFERKWDRLLKEQKKLANIATVSILRKFKKISDITNVLKKTAFLVFILGATIIMINDFKKVINGLKIDQEKPALASNAQAKLDLASNNNAIWKDAIERLQFENDLDADTLFLLGDRLAKLNPKDGNNLKEACEWFKKAAEKGNEEGIKAVKSKVCEQVL